MARLRMTLLGGFQARLDDGRVLALSIKKAQALVAYLSLPLGHVHPRDKLAGLLWGDVREPQARAGLRHVLFMLKKALGDTSALRLEGETVALDLAVVTADVREFEQCLAGGSLEALERAAGLYQGDLLEGLVLEEPPFEAWLMTERLRLRELAIEALARLLVRQREAEQHDAGVQTALRLLSLDPLQEPVHRTLMRLYALLGRRGAALRQYQVCVDALQRELRAEPEAETKTLYRDILQRSATRRPAASPSRASTTVADVPPAHVEPATGALGFEGSLVGREVELGQLRDALQAAWAGQGQLIAVIGEAGIGKSRLAAELNIEAGRKGGRVLVGRCHESEQVLPFGPWIDAFRGGRLAGEEAVLGQLGAVWRGELARLVPQIAESPPAPTSGPAQLFEAVAQLLHQVSLIQPIVLILEDVHWADEMSLRLLAFVGRRLARSRILALVTAREENLPDSPSLRHTLDELERGDHVVRRALEPLDRESTMALARSIVVSGDTVPPDEQLWRASEGNPFMIVETLHAARGGHTTAGAAALPLPERVRTLIASRVERVGERSRRLVSVAAVIGRPFDFALLERAAALGEAPAAEGLEELVRHRLLRVGDDGFEFAHDRIREVVYTELLPPRRALIHRAVAEALEAVHAGHLDQHALALGTHYRHGHVWPKAALYLTQAGMHAAQRYAHRDAVVCYDQALTAVAHLPDSREAREHATDARFKLAHSLYQMGDFARAMASFREAEQLGLALDDPDRLGEIYAGMAYLLGSQGDFAGAIQAGLRALTIATSLADLPLQVWTSISLGRVHYARGDLGRAIERMRWVSEALKDVPLDERFGRSSLLPSAACRAWLALCLAGTGDFAEALAWGNDGVRISDAVGGPHERVWARYCLSRVHLARGDAGHAMVLLEEAVPLCEGRIPLYYPRVVASLGRALTLIGDLDGAIPLLARAMAEVEAIKLLFGHPMILVWTAAAHRDAGHLAEAEGYATTALDLSRRDGGRGDEAWALHSFAEIAARRAPPALDLALEQCTRALRLAEELGMAPLQARCHLSLGTLRRRAGEAEEAHAELSRAVDMLRRMEMRHWLSTAEMLLATG